MPDKPRTHQQDIRARGPRRPDDRLSASVRGYGARHKQHRNAYLLRHPVCAVCGAYRSGNGTDLHLDHIIPLQEGGTNTVGNYQALCSECHGRKTREEMASRAREGGE